MADRSPRLDDRGAVLVIATLLLTAMMTMAAVVVDLGHMRGMRSSTQSVADFAALAAADSLADASGPDARQGCEDAVRYLRANAGGLSTVSVDCSPLPASCPPGTAPVTVTGSTDDYEVAITYPVNDSAIADPTATGGLRVDDGGPCDRMMVEVRQSSRTFFSGLLGFDELSSGASAVVRQIPEYESRIPSLWLLDPYGCNVLSVQGGSQVRAGKPGFGGLISLDSAGLASHCGGNAFTVDVGGSGSLLEAFPVDADPSAQISLYAMAPGQQGCTGGNPRACDPADVANGTLKPEPVRRNERATRAPVDHRFNCRTDATPITSYPSYHGLTIPQCDEALGSGDFIDQLRAAVGTSGTPSGFTTISGGACNMSAGHHVIPGNVFVNCSTFSVGNNTHVEFTGGNVVFAGSISISNGGRLSLNTNNPNPTLSAECQTRVTGCLTESSAGAAWVYQRSGDIQMTGGEFVAHRTAFYQHHGYFRMTGGFPRWSAPTEGPFTSLAYWSEMSSSRFQITGGTEMELTGIFFTPEARPFTLNGGAPVIPQEAQFISFRAAIAGGANLQLAPLEIQPLTIPPPAPQLIR